MTPRTSTKRLLPWLAGVALFMESLDTTILTSAIPRMSHALGVAPLAMKSVLSYYTLSLAVFIPISGWLADRFGTRRVFLSAIGVFTASSLLCALAGDVAQLAAFRLLQGLGGAMMVPVIRLTLVRAFPRAELVGVLSMVSIGAIVGPMLGPTVGAAIVELASWRMIFFVHLPIGVVGMFLVARRMPDFRALGTPRLDLVGFAMFGAALALASFVLEGFDQHRTSTAGNLGLIAIVIALLVAYLVHAARTPQPILRLGLLAIPTLRIAVTGTVLTRIAFGGFPFLVALLYQVGFGLSPLQAGLLVLPQPLAAMACKPWISRILARLGHRTTLVAVSVFGAAAIASFAAVDRAAPVWILLALVAAVGFCASLVATSLATLAYADVQTADTSMAATIVSTLQQLSMSFGVVAAALITSLSLPDRAHANSPEIVSGLHHGLIGLGAFTLLSTWVFARLHPSDGHAVSHFRA